MGNRVEEGTGTGKEERYGEEAKVRGGKGEQRRRRWRKKTEKKGERKTGRGKGME